MSSFHTFLRDVFNGGCEHTTNDVEKEIKSNKKNTNFISTERMQ